MARRSGCPRSGSTGTPGAALHRSINEAVLFQWRSIQGLGLSGWRFGATAFSGRPRNRGQGRHLALTFSGGSPWRLPCSGPPPGAAGRGNAFADPLRLRFSLRGHGAMPSPPSPRPCFPLGTKRLLRPATRCAMFRKFREPRRSYTPYSGDRRPAAGFLPFLWTFVRRSAAFALSAILSVSRGGNRALADLVPRAVDGFLFRDRRAQRILGHPRARTGWRFAVCSCCLRSGDPDSGRWRCSNNAPSARRGRTA